MSPSRSPAQLAEFLSTVERKLSALRGSEEVLRGVTRLAVDQVDGAEYAGVTRGFQGRFTSVAPTDDLVERVDRIQYRLASGPCVDAVINSHVYCAGDLRTDSRWPDFGREAFRATGVLSMLSFRLYLENDDTVLAALNMYSTKPAAFDESSEITSGVLATAGAMTIATAHAREKVDNLEIALRTSREIGIAIGVLMATHKIAREQAFDLLRLTSQATHRKLADIAGDVADTGALPDVPMSRSRAGS